MPTIHATNVLITSPRFPRLNEQNCASTVGIQKDVYLQSRNLSQERDAQRNLEEQNTSRGVIDGSPFSAFAISNTSTSTLSTGPSSRSSSIGSITQSHCPATPNAATADAVPVPIARENHVERSCPPRRFPSPEVESPFASARTPKTTEPSISGLSMLDLSLLCIPPTPTHSFSPLSSSPHSPTSVLPSLIPGDAVVFELSGLRVEGQVEKMVMKDVCQVMISGTGKAIQLPVGRIRKWTGRFC